MNPANSQEALAQLQQAQAQAQNPNQILASQRQQLGVQGAQDTVTGLRGAINNTTKLLKQVAPSVMGRTGSSLVTNAQATRQIANEQAPIAQNLSEQGTSLSDADRTLNELNRQAQEAASGIYTGQQDKLSYAQNLYNTLYAREQATEAARQAEIDRQEEIRQFNEQLAQTRRAQAAGDRTFDLGSGQGDTSAVASDANAPSLTGGRTKSQATSAVQELLRQPASVIARTWDAILESAKRGNTYDQAKLELLRASLPSWVTSEPGR